MAKKPASKSPSRTKKSAAHKAEGSATAATKAPTRSAARGRRRGPARGTGFSTGDAKNRHLVIVESPSKAKTINKYLGKDYLVLASVGHVRDLPSKNPKGVKAPVPGVDLEHRFKPTYVVSEDKEKVISDLKRAAKETLSSGREVWFATDLDREGEAIAWHLAQELGISAKTAKRVIFAAITKGEIEKAFSNPHPIDEDRVNAQQARRILDRIVGYQVSPLLWKKVARGLSAGRVQSVAVRLVVEREREIRAFIPDEEWSIGANFALTQKDAEKLGPGWRAFLATRDEKKNPPTVKAQNAWLSDHHAIRADLVEYNGKKFDSSIRIDQLLGSIADFTSDAIRDRLERASAEFSTPEKHDLSKAITRIADSLGLRDARATLRDEPTGRGPARWVRTITGNPDPSLKWLVDSIETKRTKVRPAPPFITSTLQQAASSRLGFGAQRTMRAAQQLYEGVDIPGEGPVGLITYMRTDSTHLSGDALSMARTYIGSTFGDKYLPEKPNFFTSSNKAAQEAHEAIRPTNPAYTPDRVRNSLSPDQARLYQLIWERFVACQMTPAEWDSTTALIKGGKPGTTAVFKTSGRVLIFDGFYRVSGVPKGDDLNLPALSTQQPLHAFDIQPSQRFTSPPARYSEASLIKVLEAEGIGRPSTYASIISVIQDRNYVEALERRFYATDLGEVVTDKLIEAFPNILDVGYTREMESQLDKVEEDHLDWVDMLARFYGPFKRSLEEAETTLKHAKAETTPAPDEYKCPQCGSPLVYRFGKNGRFLSCSTYPECNYASPVDREGKPRPAAETVDVACPKCGSAMTKRVGRFGPFLGCSKYGDKTAPCDGILNLDRKGRVVAPSAPAYATDIPCPTCESPLHLRTGTRGPWLGCSRFPKCRGRGKWNDLPEEKREELLKALQAHEKANPVPVIKTMSGRALTDSNGKPLPNAEPIGVKPDEEPAEMEDAAEETAA
ncbi:MAG: type I DNA topoisomerase [Phycisphaerales bacterium]|nr:MAG: type I DNA topoisomerase [Phycisphaerales bacterium]